MTHRRYGPTRSALWSALAVVALLLVAEGVSRAWLGLGTPPLYEPDAGFEYRLRPDQDVHRFGNHVMVNRWGMRSPDFENTKGSADEFRVMVFGDSVVNGGSQIDQSNLSTSLLQTALQRHMNRPVTVGNISAGSWGPGNWLAYAQRFGFFGADVVVLVVGSGDHADNPSFAPLDADHPTQTPTLALQEAIERFLPRYLPEPLRGLVRAPSADPVPQTSKMDSARGLADLKRFLQLAQSEGRNVVVMHHPDREEFLGGGYLDGHQQIHDSVEELSLPFVELRTPYLAVGPSIYRDNVHHSVQGQRTMADAMLLAVLPALPGGPQ